MTPAEVDMIRTSFVQILPQADEFGPKFYDRLFSLDPAFKDMFKEDMAVQSKKLVRMLATLVANIDSLETVVPTLEALAIRHVGYGVRDEHYNAVGQSLLWTLEQQLGEAFTPEVRNAWIATYVLIAETMKAAAHDAIDHSAKGNAPAAEPAAPH
jgi:hemoglobin-like flavoprotein